MATLDPFEHDAHVIDSVYWPPVDHLPLKCEMRDCSAPVDPRAEAETVHVCTSHMPAWITA